MIKKISTSAPLDQQASTSPTELAWLKHAQRVYIISDGCHGYNVK